MKMTELSEAALIFAKYDDSDANTYAEHDVFYIAVDPDKVSKADKKRLKELGWHESEDGGAFEHFT